VSGLGRAAAGGLGLTLNPSSTGARSGGGLGAGGGLGGGGGPGGGGGSCGSGGLSTRMRQGYRVTVRVKGYGYG